MKMRSAMPNTLVKGSRARKTTTPGSRGGAARLTPIKSGPTVQQPFVSGHRIAKGKVQVAPSFRTKTSNPRVKARGTAKVAQGGESETATGLSRTNLGRQRL